MLICDVLIAINQSMNQWICLNQSSIIFDVIIATDEEFEEVPDKEGYEADIPEHVKLEAG